MPTCEGYRFGDFVLDVPQKRLQQADGSVVELTPRVFAALLLLVERAGLLVERQTLLDRVWPGLVVGENSLSQVIVTLRRTLGDDAQGSRFIQTVPRKGFRFVAAVIPVAPARRAMESPAPAPVEAAATVVPSGLDLSSARAAPGSALPRRRVLAGAAGLAVLAVGGAAWWRWRATPRAGPTPATTLAVMPFRLLGEADQDRLLDVGMADSVIGRLSTLPGLAVLAPASVGRFANGASDPLQAAKELQADWVVDGSVQRVGDRLRVVARLHRAGDAASAWSEVTDQQASSLFELQDRVATGIARALTERAPAVGMDSSWVMLGGTRSVEAYQLYLTAAWRAQGGSAADVGRSVALLEQAIAIDPGFAQAWAMLAWVHRRHLWRADTPPAEVFANSDAAVARALALVPNLALARAGRGFSRFWFDFDWQGAEAEFRAALATNPSESGAQWGMAFLLLTQGRREEGFEHMRLARQIDPMSPVLHTAEAGFLISASRYAEAHRSLQMALDIAPKLWLPRAALGRLRVAEGRTAEGIAELRHAVEMAPDTVRVKAHLAMQLALHGQADEARAILEQIRQRMRARYVPPTSPAMILAALGEPAAALDELERAYELRDTRLIELACDSSWATLRGQPRFEALARRLGLEHVNEGLASF